MRIIYRDGTTASTSSDVRQDSSFSLRGNAIQVSCVVRIDTTLLTAPLVIRRTFDFWPLPWTLSTFQRLVQNFDASVKKLMLHAGLFGTSVDVAISPSISSILKIRVPNTSCQELRNVVLVQNKFGKDPDR